MSLYPAPILHNNALNSVFNSSDFTTTNKLNSTNVAGPLTVSGLATFNGGTQVKGSETITGMLYANGGITTNNAIIDAGSGSLTCGAITNSGITTSTNYAIYKNTNKTNTNSVFFTNSGTNNQWGIQQYDYLASGMGSLYLSRIGTNDIVIAGTTGYVGINTTSPAYQLDVNGTTNISGALTATTLTASGLVTASAGLTVPSGQTLAANGGISATTLTTSGINTFAGKINANNGVYLGADKNYVLQDPGSSYVRPTNSANGCVLGYTASAAVTGTTYINITTTAKTNILSLDLSAGTYIIQYGLNNLFSTGNTSYTTTSFIIALSTSNLSTGTYDIDYSCDTTNGSYTTATTTKSNMTVYTSVNSFTAYLIARITASVALQTQGFINATRIQ